MAIPQAPIDALRSLLRDMYLAVELHDITKQRIALSLAIDWSLRLQGILLMLEVRP